MTAIDAPRLDGPLEQFDNQAVGDLAAAISGLKVDLHGGRVALTPHSSAKGPTAGQDGGAAGSSKTRCGRASGGAETTRVPCLWT